MSFRVWCHECKAPGGVCQDTSLPPRSAHRAPVPTDQLGSIPKGLTGMCYACPGSVREHGAAGDVGEVTLKDSAPVEVSSVPGTLRMVMRPLVLPGVATTLLYTFLFSWTEFLGALTFLTTQSRYTLPVALLNVETGTYGAVNYGHLVAGAVISMIPVVILYVALQRYYVQGLISGAVKG